MQTFADQRVAIGTRLWICSYRAQFFLIFQQFAHWVQLSSFLVLGGTVLHIHFSLTNVLFPLIFFSAMLALSLLINDPLIELTQVTLCSVLCLHIQHTGCLYVCLQAADMWSNVGAGCREREEERKREETWHLAGQTNRTVVDYCRGEGFLWGKLKRFNEAHKEGRAD